MPRAAAERQREFEALKRQQDTVKNTRDDAIRQRCKALIEEAPELLVLVVETQLAENVTFKQIYDQAMTPAENLLSSAWSGTLPTGLQTFTLGMITT